VASRLLRHFHLINLPDLTQDTMVNIFSLILGGFRACVE
jgi:hypothetical protein